MAFFDKLSKTVTEASQKTIAKTKELADVSRLNSMIFEEEKIIKNNYQQIGKLYVSIHKEDFEEEFSEMVTAIVESETKIKEYKEQMNSVKCMQRCPNCGTEVPNGSGFCSSCGNAISKIKTPDPFAYIKCESCGVVLKKGVHFCTACGKPIQVAYDVSTVSIPKVESVQEQKCPNCGMIMAEDLAFCTECGTRIQ